MIWNQLSLSGYFLEGIFKVRLESASLLLFSSLFFICQDIQYPLSLLSSFFYSLVVKHVIILFQSIQLLRISMPFFFSLSATCPLLLCVCVCVLIFFFYISTDMSVIKSPSKLFLSINRNVEWFVLDETLKIIQLKIPYHGEGHLPLDQVAQSSTQPGPEHI